MITSSNINNMTIPAATKTVYPTSISPGGTATCTLTLNNQKCASIYRVYVTDKLPAGLSLVPGSITLGNYILDDETLGGNYSLGGMNPNSKMTITYKVKASSSVKPGTVLASAARFTDACGNDIATTPSAGVTIKGCGCGTVPPTITPPAPPCTPCNKPSIYIDELKIDKIVVSSCGCNCNDG